MQFFPLFRKKSDPELCAGDLRHHCVRGRGQTPVKWQFNLALIAAPALKWFFVMGSEQ